MSDKPKNTPELGENKEKFYISKLNLTVKQAIETDPDKLGNATIYDENNQPISKIDLELNRSANLIGKLKMLGFKVIRGRKQGMGINSGVDLNIIVPLTENVNEDTIYGTDLDINIDMGTINYVGTFGEFEILSFLGTHHSTIYQNFHRDGKFLIALKSNGETYICNISDEMQYDPNITSRSIFIHKGNLVLLTSTKPIIGEDLQQTDSLSLLANRRGINPESFKKIELNLSPIKPIFDEVKNKVDELGI